MRLKRLLVSAAVTAAAATVLLPGVATAKVSNVSVSPQTVEAGHHITITGACDNGATSATMWYGNLDGDGEPFVQLDNVKGDDESISGTLLISDATAPGSYLAVMQCSAQATVLGTAQFNVASGGTNAGGGSAAEGVDLILFIGGGMLLLAAVAGTFYYRHNERTSTG
ncbi:hypothetical protein ACFQ3B_19700 [Stackebrandtia endophytica]|uniref:hypothetical protein n=1 Tax=Stackebrandtia endophytica TaxID=1496996 RepID=UPI00115084D6|nr:hypothetical protein [Stackebrandtia endophytica]